MLPNYYKVLGVNPTCTAQDVRDAYRQQALKLHPDKNPNQNTTTYFQVVKEAYEVLIDTSKRFNYEMKFDSTEQASKKTKETTTKLKRKHFRKFHEDIHRKSHKDIEHAQALEEQVEDKLNKNKNIEKSSNKKSSTKKDGTKKDGTKKNNIKHKGTGDKRTVGRTFRNKSRIDKLEQKWFDNKALERRKGVTPPETLKKAKETKAGYTERDVERRSRTCAKGTPEWQRNQDLAKANQQMYKLQADAMQRQIQKRKHEIEAKKQATGINQLTKALATPGKAVTWEHIESYRNLHQRLSTSDQKLLGQAESVAAPQSSSSSSNTHNDKELTFAGKGCTDLTTTQAERERAAALTAQLSQARATVSQLSIARSGGSELVVQAHQKTEAEREASKRAGAVDSAVRHRARLVAIKSEVRGAAREVAAREQAARMLERAGASADAVDRARRGKTQPQIRFGSRYNAYASVEEAAQWDPVDMRGGYVTAEEVYMAFGMGRRPVEEARVLGRAMARYREDVEIRGRDVVNGKRIVGGGVEEYSGYEIGESSRQ
ncbi:hypothetical protein F4810DRAFT_718166 [Camillea tinctor]|nr:hypothetical protein F4810DRAFT_718166 [Camillea tinctor]